jgi:hypothetical protein
VSKDQSYPYAGNPRTFRAVAMPNGDARFGVAGPLVFLAEQRASASSSGAVGREEFVDRPKFLTRDEAEQLRDELGAALRCFDLAKELARDVAALPRAYRGPYPIRDHGTLADNGFLDDAEAA